MSTTHDVHRSPPGGPDPYVDRSTRGPIGYGWWWLLALLVLGFLIWGFGSGWGRRGVPTPAPAPTHSAPSNGTGAPR